MNVVLHRIERRDDGLIDLLVGFGKDSPKTYSATFDASHNGYTFGDTNEELFFELSDLAHKRFGNSAVYQMELMGILGALERGERLPKLPATFGTTRFCTLRPSLVRVAWNKFTILLCWIGILRPKMWVHADYRDAA